MIVSEQPLDLILADEKAHVLHLIPLSNTEIENITTLSEYKYCVKSQERVKHVYIYVTHTAVF